MGNRRSLIAVGHVALVALVTFGWIGLRAGEASACTCGPGDPLEPVDDVDVVFLASATEQLDPESSFPMLTFQVDTVVEGEVPRSFEMSAGATTGCGPAYAQRGARHVVYIYRSQDGLGLLPCAPLVRAGDFVQLAGSGGLTMTRVDQVGHDIDARAADFAELLESDRRGYERSIGFGSDR